LVNRREKYLIELKARDRDFIVAIHEAAHAVACHRLGVAFHRVSISREGGSGVAAVDTETVSCLDRGSNDSVGEALRLERFAARCRAQIIVAYAGPSAELRGARCGLTAAVGLASGAKDERDARFFVRELVKAEVEIAAKKGEYVVKLEDLPQRFVEKLEALHREAEALVEADFEVIEAVARRLADVGQLSSADVAELSDLAR